jgi:hypothetical protein
MISDDGPSATELADHAGASPGGGQLSSAGRPGTLIAYRTRLIASRRRPWWKWLLIGLLLAFSLAATGLYLVALIRDLSLRHWGAALDASRAAVPAAVAWGALLLVFFPRSSAEAEELLSADNDALAERLGRAARDRASMDKAEYKVQRLTARLANLTAARGRATAAAAVGSDAVAATANSGVIYLDPGTVYLGLTGAELDRDVAETTARLDQARQWLASARDAVAASQRGVTDAEERLMTDFPGLMRRSDQTAHKTP